MMVGSFDIDGAMEFGNPPGPIAVALVQAMAQLGHVVGSGSDRTRSDQAQLWEAHVVDIHFVGGKHHLPDVRARCPGAPYVHIGATDVAAPFAKPAGFDFYGSHEFAWTD